MSHQCACARVFLFAFYVQPSTMLVLMRFCIFYLQLAYFNILKQVAIGCHASAPRRNIGNSTGLGQNRIFARLEFLFIFLNNKLRSFIYIYIYLPTLCSFLDCVIFLVLLNIVPSRP